jgi:hypothetical protein
MVAVPKSVSNVIHNKYGGNSILGTTSYETDICDIGLDSPKNICHFIAVMVVVTLSTLSSR